MDFPEEEFSEPDQACSVDTDNRNSEKGLRVSKTARLQKRAATDKRCTSCGTTSTPVWRWGGEAKETLLCNACSLRIRRSTGRPNRAKSPGEKGAKRVQSLTSSESGEARQSKEATLTDQIVIEDEGFRARLIDLVNKERLRLLGVPAQASAEDLWADLLLSSSDITAPSTPHPPEWDPFPSVPQYSYDELSDTGRLDFGSPMSSSFHSWEQGLVGEIF